MSTTTVATEKTLIEDVDQEDELSKIRITNDINIKYLNKTGRVDFAVAVFVQNSDANAVDSPYVAWYVLRTQSSAKFVWSKSQEVGVEYEVDGAKMTAGPVTAEAGSTWDFVHEQADSTPYLRRGNAFYMLANLFCWRFSCLCYFLQMLLPILMLMVLSLSETRSHFFGQDNPTTLVSIRMEKP